MEIKVVRKKEFKTSSWSGGTTTQLLIYPEDAVYSERNFLWRVSSAKVEVEESLFTSLPGISRILMVIEGKLKIEHEGHHFAFLEPLQQDSFLGEWTTRAFGRVTDFNLMMGKGCNGRLEAVYIESGNPVNLAVDGSKEGFSLTTEVLYAVEGAVRIGLQGEAPRYVLEKGDLLAVTRKASEEGCLIELENMEVGEGKVIRSVILY